MDKDVYVSPHEWCRCFDKTDRPCAAVKRRITPELIGKYYEQFYMHVILLFNKIKFLKFRIIDAGVYVPSCDSQGYYRPTQCNSASGMCWCVDKHGVEFANTRTHSRPNCGKL